MNTEHEYVGVIEGSRILNVSPPTLYKLWRSGKIRGFRVSGVSRLKFRRSDLVRLSQAEEVMIGESV